MLGSTFAKTGYVASVFSETVVSEESLKDCYKLDLKLCMY